MMTNGPNARIGRVMDVDIAAAAHPRARCSSTRATTNTASELLSFLDEFEHGAAGRPAASRAAA